jgi:hypothetical protein
MSSSMFGTSFDAQDAKTVATFWAATLGRTVSEGADGDNAVVEEIAPAAGGSRIGLHRVPEGKTSSRLISTTSSSGSSG